MRAAVMAMRHYWVAHLSALSHLRALSLFPSSRHMTTTTTRPAPQIPTGLEIVGKVFEFTQWP